MRSDSPVNATPTTIDKLRVENAKLRRSVVRLHKILRHGDELTDEITYLCEAAQRLAATLEKWRIEE